FESVDAFRVVDPGQVLDGPFADARDLRAFLGLAPHDDHRGILFLEELSSPHDRSGGAHARNKMSDAPTRYVPDLGPGTAIVGERIVLVRKLVEDDAAAFGA